MRIFHVISGFENGGVEMLLLRLFSHAPSDVKLHVVAHEIPVPECAERFRASGVTVHTVPSRKHPLAHLCALRALFRAHRPDVVHVHTTEWGALALWAAKKEGISCRIQHSHAARREKNPFVRMAHTVLFALARRTATDYFACGSDAARTAFGKKANCATILKNGIDVSEFAFDAVLRRATREALGLREGQTAVGMVARFSPQKNHARAIELFAAYRAKDPGAVLLLVGDGALRAKVEAQAQKRLPKEAVRFLGVRNDMAALYAAMDLFILPSRFEGLPITLVEAQTCGLPAVVADTVTREADLCGALSFVDTANTAEWVTAMETAAVTERGAFAVRVAASGYSQSESAKALWQFYQSKI